MTSYIRTPEEIERSARGSYAGILDPRLRGHTDDNPMIDQGDVAPLFSGLLPKPPKGVKNPTYNSVLRSAARAAEARNPNPYGIEGPSNSSQPPEAWTGTTPFQGAKRALEYRPSEPLPTLPGHGAAAGARQTMEWRPERDGYPTTQLLPDYGAPVETQLLQDRMGPSLPQTAQTVTGQTRSIIQGLLAPSSSPPPASTARPPAAPRTAREAYEQAQQRSTVESQARAEKLAELRARIKTNQGSREQQIADLRSRLGARPSVMSSTTQGEVDNTSRESFIRTAYPYALEAADGDPNLAQQLVATAISENGKVGTGRSLGEMGFNVGGIQGVEGTAGSFTALDAGRERKFAAYNNLSEGFRAVRDLVSGGRYAQAAANYRQTGDIDRYWREVNEAGYSETPNWQDMVGSIRRNQVAPIVSQLPETPNPAPVAQAISSSTTPQQQTKMAQSGTSVWEAGRLTPNQLTEGMAQGLDRETALAVCGPAAAIAFARKTGRNPSLTEALAMAKEVGWTLQNGMAGPASQVKLLQRMGISASMDDGEPNTAKIAQSVQSGNPVIINTPGHYFVAERYDPATGKFDFGESAKVLKIAKGNSWFTIDELNGLNMGRPRATIYMAGA